MVFLFRNFRANPKSFCGTYPWNRGPFQEPQKKRPCLCLCRRNSPKYHGDLGGFSGDFAVGFAQKSAIDTLPLLTPPPSSEDQY